MITPQYILDINNEIIVDNFAGGGGASTGIELALGRHVNVAINHDPEAVSMHQANHPQTVHHCESVWEVNPREVMPGRKIGLLWLSPDCKHFSKAKGGKPVEKKIRGLAWVALRWAATRKPRVIMLENVEEFVTWGPLVEGSEGSDGNMRPCPKNKGREFNAFRNALKRQGYTVDHKELRACDYGTPTIRKRLFLIARCDGQPIVWPEPTHFDPKIEEVRHRERGEKRRPAWRTAAECMDWSIPCPSIFERKKPLAEATLRRIAKGIMRYVVNAAEPFIVPLRTQCAQTKGGHFALATANLVKHYTGVVGSDLRDPVGTVTSVDHHSLVTSNLIKMRGDNIGQPDTEPLHTVSAQGTHFAEVRAFLIKYYGNEREGIEIDGPLHTVTARDRFGIVTVEGEEYAINDIGLRMLAPRELFRAQGFPENYIIDRGLAIDQEGNIIWKPLTKTAQVRMVGNSVCPPLAAALVRANCADMIAIKEEKRRQA